MYLFCLSLRVERKKQENLLKERSQQFQLKSIKYFLQFNHGIQLIQLLFTVWAPTLELVILGLFSNQ